MIKKLVALAFCAAFGLTSFSALAEEDHHHHYYHHHYYHHDAQTVSAANRVVNINLLCL
jgi:hypothetical protein